MNGGGTAQSVLASPAPQETSDLKKSSPTEKSFISASALATIGDEKENVVRVIAFSAGGADNAFEFGMVHAFLVSDAAKPHIVAGTSSGAVVAAMLADVLQAGESEGSATARRRLAQVARFRSFLEQIIRLPSDLKEAALPDFTEVSARTGLVPLNLPTQQPLEKEDRKTTALARFGLTRLFNGMLSSRVEFRELTRIIRLVLELQALGEWHWKLGRRVLPAAMVSALELPALFWLTVWTGFRIWLRTMVPGIREAPLLTRCALAPGREWFIRKPFLRDFLERIGFPRLRDAKSILFEPWWIRLSRGGLLVLSYPLVALTWLFAPPALAMWLVLNRVARLVPIGNKRSAVLRVSGVAILLASALFVVWNYGEILKSYAELSKILARLSMQNFTEKNYSDSGKL